MIGVTEIPISKRVGVFRCPGCRMMRPYRWRGIRRFLTIYFIPVVPLYEVSEHVRCDICKDRFSPRVLAGGRLRLDSASINGAVILAALRLTLADDETTRAELNELKRLIYDRIGMRAATEDILGMRDWVAHPQSPSAAVWLTKARAMSEVQRDRAVRDLFQVASADQDLRPFQVAELADMPQQLEISERLFRKLVEEACLVATVAPSPEALL